MYRDRRHFGEKKALFRKAVPQKKQKAPNIINNKLGTSFVKNPCVWAVNNITAQVLNWFVHSYPLRSN